MEYPAPKARRAAFTRSGADGPPPAMTALTAEKSSSLMNRWRTMSAIRGATPVTAAIRCRATASRAPPADQRPRRWAVWPPSSSHGSLAMKPTWAMGVMASP